MKSLLLGNEALAQGSIDAGLSGVYAYPGTPSTEITEYIQRSKLAKELKIHTTWSVNEKTAMESALGMSYTGLRAMVVMKHVGLNVASDVFMNMAPDSGYKSSWAFSRKAGDPGYFRNLDTKFYFRNKDGTRYGWLEFLFRSATNESSSVYLRYWINPSGSRNLEYDVSKRIFIKK